MRLVSDQICFSDDQETVTWNNGSINTFQPQRKQISLGHKSATEKWQAIFLFWGAVGLRATGVVVLMMFDIAPPKTNMSPEKWPF